MASPEEQYKEFVHAHGGTKPIRRLVVANNGMAATKFILSVRNWLFENFGDEKLIHIVAMATPEVRVRETRVAEPGAFRCPPTRRLSRSLAGYQGSCRAHRRRRRLPRGASAPTRP